MKNKKKPSGKYIKAQTPEMIKKQRAAIIDYYIKKRKEENPKKH